MKRLNLKKVIVLISFYSLGTYSQIPNAPVVALTPNAANLGLYGDVPVSLFTGVPQISIPLYELKFLDFILPISLDYHSGSIRPDQKSGWTGLGWTLNAGGAIIRTMQDLADEYSNLRASETTNSGYYFNHAVLNTPSWNQYSYLCSVAEDAKLSNYRDTRPDEFSFYFAGYSGKFYLDHNRNWVVQCNKPVKVEFDGTFLEPPFDKTDTAYSGWKYPLCFSGFTITTEDGTRYVFGKDINAIDFSINFFNQSIAEWIATSWYLTKIILPTKQELVFTYDRVGFDNQMQIAVEFDLYSYTESNGGFFSPHPECSSYHYSSIGRCYQGQLISPVYLNRITADNTSIYFHKSISNELKYAQSIYSSKHADYNYASKYPFLKFLNSKTDGYPGCLDNLKSYKLDRIEIKTQATTRKVIYFGYNDNPTQRLALETVSEAGKEPYRFSYNNFDALPNYLANKTDHWGFYNDTYADLGSYTNYYNLRNPNASCAKYGVLEKIIYPTGGYTEFEFEPHYYRKQLSLNRWENCNTLSSNQLAGGVRIKRIKNSATQEGPAEIYKEYYYVTDYLSNKDDASISSGVLGGQFKYYFDDYIVIPFNDSTVRRKMSKFYSISVLPACSNAQGSHIGYTEVIEKRSDNSFSRYLFTNFDNGHMDEPADAFIQQSRTPYEPYASKSMERGNLILQEDYNANGDKVKSKSISYEKNVQDNNYVRTMKATSHGVCEGTGIRYAEGTAYKIYTYLMQPKEETEIFYNQENGNEEQHITTKYNYKNKLLLSKSIENSNGVVHQTYYKYPCDYTDVVSQKMVSNNIYSNVVEKVEIIRNGAYANVLNIAHNRYNEVHPGIFKPEILSVFNGKLAVETYENSGSGQFLKPEIYYKYNEDGNVIEMTHAGSELSTVYLWANNGQHMVAEIKNASYNYLMETLSSSQQSLLNTVLSSYMQPTDLMYLSFRNMLIDALPQALITTYTYAPFVGMTSQTIPNGTTIHYEYDFFGRLKATYIMENEHKKIINTYEYHYANQ